MKPKHHNLGNETPYYKERRRERTKKGMRRNAATLVTLGIHYGPHRVSQGGRTYLIHPIANNRYRLECGGEDLFSGTFNEVLRTIWSQK